MVQFILNDLKYIAVTGCDLKTAADLEEAHQIATEKYINNIQNYSFVNELKIEFESTETVNGIEMYCFEGSAASAGSYTDREETYDAYIKGFTFILEGICHLASSTFFNRMRVSFFSRNSFPSKLPVTV